MSEQILRLYLHIPFCVRKCLYCDFVSFAGREDLFGAYTDALCREIEAYGRHLSGYEIASVYIGGGTPSILPEEQMAQITETLIKSFRISGIREKRRGFHLQKKIRPRHEFSIECNPGTVSKGKLKAYKKMGINRLSFGLQSADDKDLKMLGRIHSFGDFEQSFEAAREAGFGNINVDLMQAIPGQTLQAWQRVLALLAVYKPEHISAYSLMVEEGTPFFEKQMRGELPLPDEDTEREIYYYTRDFLEKSGYRRYEISNYALPGFSCSHNTGYWKRDPYLGLGLNASSLLHNVRWKNTEDPEQYLTLFSDPEAAEERAAALLQAAEEGRESFGTEEAPFVLDYHRLSHKEQMEEFLFLGLRLTEGIGRQEFFDTFHQDFDFTYGETVRDLKEKGLLSDNGERIFLTDRGIDLSNTVLAEFL